MRKQINGKRYDTDSAKFVTIIKLNNEAHAVYFKKTNELFCENLERQELKILSEKEQERLKNTPEIKKRIADITSFMRAKKVQINPYITAETRNLLTLLAKEKNLTESEIIELAIKEFSNSEKKLKELRKKAIESIKSGKSFFT